ncbi:hypothetical protein JM93_00199 [Roseibium hamelinense]|uniref:Uncharacterized protein n=1 Tax=Roseibium hamelinense TaxID=150831 RepID=A0A562TIE4_9HYPH|nr:hypothetical protein [Roseibium hamelinense]MTI46151.1 hypothetical protein [Roseibium hamelinense]TWI92656.1 hypothetical protein JM93_00199 [Roseibium hamelinense]
MPCGNALVVGESAAFSGDTFRSPEGALDRLAVFSGLKHRRWYIAAFASQIEKPPYAGLFCGKTAPLDQSSRAGLEPKPIVTLMPPDRVTIPQWLAIKAFYGECGAKGAPLIIGQLATAPATQSPIWLDTDLRRTAFYAVAPFIFHALT